MELQPVAQHKKVSPCKSCKFLYADKERHPECIKCQAIGDTWLYAMSIGPMTDSECHVNAPVINPLSGCRIAPEQQRASNICGFVGCERKTVKAKYCKKHSAIVHNRKQAWRRGKLKWSEETWDTVPVIEKGHVYDASIFLK